MSRNTNNRSIIENLEGRRLYSTTGAINFDINRDGEFNGDDLYVVDSNVGQKVSGWANGDLNGDNEVTAADQTLMTLAYEGSLDSDVQTGTVLLPGDADGNGEVNGDDLFVMDSVVGTHEGTWAEGDFNGDGYVDESDYIIVNATSDVDPDTGAVIDGDEWFEIDSNLLQDAVSAFHG